MTNHETNGITKSNFQMLKELLKDFHPGRPGISSAAEVFLSQKYDRDTEKHHEALDIMSAMTGVIDTEKIRRVVACRKQMTKS